LVANNYNPKEEVMELRQYLKEKFVLKDTHTMYVVDNNGLVSEIAEARKPRFGIKFCAKEYRPHKKEVAAMRASR